MRLNRIKNHPVTSTLIIIGSVVGFMGTFTNSLQNLYSCYVQFKVMPNPEIKIISPKEGDDVSVKNEVGVNFSGKLPEGQYMWVVVNPATSPLQWWPQGGIEASKGIWTIKATFGEEKKDVGDKFNIAVILVNEKDNQSYKDYLKRGIETGNYPPIPLPDSAKIINKITVIRR